ncbi:MFS general substrate transporter [Patellaria atrata CBS 101060]|uniref:MFS general substrate transporter n=1 Tax=Patellaria atrata CBS 101060 TaxID=1346257 RepID=A0A9P4VK25_9PEZI|nr:MFS general substrate transporter [Patellaria atrata CBS 101060]
MTSSKPLGQRKATQEIVPSGLQTTATIDSGLTTPGSLESGSSSLCTQQQSDEPNWPREWRAYSCLFGCFLLMFNSWGLVNAYGTYASYYMQHLLPGRDILLLNLVGSTQSFIVLLLSFVVGRLLDAGFVKNIVGLGAFLVTLGMFLLSVVNGKGDYNQGNYALIWLVQGLVTGLGMACFFVSSSQVAATWFIKRKTIAIGIVASGASIAGLIYPVMTKFLIAKVGFNNAVRYVSTAVALTCVLSWWLATPNPRHPMNKVAGTKGWWRRSEIWVDSHAFRNPSFSWFVAAISIMFFGFYAIFFNLEEWAAAQGFGIKDNTPPGLDSVHLGSEVPKDAIRTFWLLSIMNACSTFGRVGTAWLGEHYGPLLVHALVTLFAALTTLLLWTLATTLPLGIAFVVLFGILSGGVIGAPPASVAWILTETSDCPHKAAKLGQWVGMMYSVSAVFALTGPVIAGHLISQFGSFVTVQCWSGACLLGAAGCMFVSWRKAEGLRRGLGRREEEGVRVVQGQRPDWSRVSTLVAEGVLEEEKEKERESDEESR